MRKLTKPAMIAAGVATLMASTAAVARPDYRHRGHDGIDAGDVIAGALVIGGIAAIASAASNNRYDRGYRYYDRGYDGYGYNRGGYGSRSAVDQCVRAAQRQAGRYGWARVTDVTRIDRIRGGYEVRGRLVVEDRGRRGSRGNWDRGYYYDRYDDGYDKGRFSCVARYGDVQYVNLSGLRGYY
jgi:hypothetical protein